SRARAAADRLAARIGVQPTLDAPEQAVAVAPVPALRVVPDQPSAPVPPPAPVVRSKSTKKVEATAPVRTGKVRGRVLRADGSESGRQTSIGPLNSTSDCGGTRSRVAELSRTSPVSSSAKLLDRSCPESTSDR